MSRVKSAGRKLEVIEHPNGMSTELRFDARGMEFTATVGPDTKTSKDGAEVRRWAKQMLGKSAIVAWVPIIDIETGHDSYYGGKTPDLHVDFELEATRYWLGQTPGGRILKLNWKQGDPKSPGHIADSEEQFAKAETFRFDGLTRYSHRDDPLPVEKLKLPRIEGEHHYLAYTPELWAGVVELIKTAQQIDDRIREMLSSTEGISEIERVGRERTPLALTAKSSV